MKNLLLLALVFVGYTAIAQEKGNFTLELNANHLHLRNAHTFNNYLRDTSSLETSYLGNKYQNDTLKTAFNFGASLSYQPLDLMDFGIFAGFQQSKFDREYKKETFENFPIVGYILEDRKIQITNTSFTLGVLTTIHLNKILQFENKESTFMKRFQLGVGLRLGYTLNMVKDTKWRESHEVIQPEGFVPNLYASEISQQVVAFNWSGNLELKVGYRFVDKNYFSGIGLKVGYQFHTSSLMKNEAVDHMKIDNTPYEMRLNLSGFYYGIYLNVGKK